WLVTTARVNIITTSLGWWAGQPTDGTSKMAQAVDRARAAGVFFSVAAGNFASGAIGSEYHLGHYAATFVDKDGDGFHDFAGAQPSNGFLLRVDRRSSVQLDLDWDDWKQTHVNYDLYLYTSNGREVAHSTDDQATMPGAEPTEFFGVKLNEGTYTIRI